MAILVTGAAGFIGYSVCDRLLARGERVIGIDNLNDYYSVSLKQDRVGALEEAHGNGFQFVKTDFAEREALARRNRRQGRRGDHSPRRAGGRALLAAQPPRLRPVQSGRPSQHVGSRPPSGRQASRLCVLLVGLWRQYEIAVQCRRSGRPAAVALCRDQEGRRTDERGLCQPLPDSPDRAALLFGLWAVGPARHGDVDLHQGHPRRATDHAVQQWRHAPRFHLHRRYRLRCRRLPRQSAGGRRPGQGRREHFARTGCTISATTGPKSCGGWSG